MPGGVDGAMVAIAARLVHVDTVSSIHEEDEDENGMIQGGDGELALPPFASGKPNDSYHVRSRARTPLKATLPASQRQLSGVLQWRENVDLQSSSVQMMAGNARKKKCS